MNILSALAGLAGIEIESIAGRIRSGVIIAVLLGLLLLIALVALLVAADLALTGWLGPVAAPLVIAGVALFLALLVYLGAQIAAAARKRKDKQRKRNAEMASAAASAALAGLPMLLKSPLVRKLGIPAAILAALVLLGMRDRRRDDD